MIMNVEGQIEKLHFSKSNITQLGYLLFVSVFFLMLSEYMNESRAGDVVYKAYMTGVALICVVTIYQMLAYNVNLPFDPIFKTSLVRDNLIENNDKWIYWDKRISGPCLEASMLAYYIVSALPLCTKLKSSKFKFLLTDCLVFIGILTLSSTFLIGTVAWVLLEFIMHLRKRSFFRFTRRHLKQKAVAVAVLIFVFLIFNYFFNIFQFLNNGIDASLMKLNKENVSGQERSESFILLMEAFFQSPFFGVRFGSVRGKDLLSTWLADIGIVGMVALTYSSL